MSGPLPQPTDSPETLQYRHLRSLAGLGCMIAGVALFVVIQFTRTAHDAAYQATVAAQGVSGTVPAPSSVPVPNTVLQLVYVFLIPVGMPLIIFLCGLMLFSPTVFGQLRGMLPWVKTP
jgi:hypothetical protein